MSESLQALNQETQPKAQPPSLRWWRNKFLAGLFVVIPVVLTFYILKLIYRLASGVLEPLIRAVVHATGDSWPTWLQWIIVKDTIPGAALLLTILLVIVIGMFATHVIGKRLVGWVDCIFLRIPLVNLIYPVFKQVMESIRSMGGSQDQFSNRSVVYVRYPNSNGFFLGFQTGCFTDARGRKMITVFLPTAPNPITGFVLIFEAGDVVESDMPMDAAWKLLVSGGFVVPKAFPDSMRPPSPRPLDTDQSPSATA